ncbi:MAG: NnrU family protein [Janthinobacterium lividum]
MSWFVAGLILFFGSHSVSIVAPAWRDRQEAILGEGAWKGLYSVVSIVGLALMLYGYGMARRAPMVLYAPPAVLRHLALLLMLPVFPLLIAAYMPGRIKALTRHPMLLAIQLWALAHVLANGTLNDVLLFGAFLGWAVIDRISVARRSGVRRVPGAPASPWNDAIAVVLGLGLYAFVLLWAHARVIGVAPLA